MDKIKENTFFLKKIRRLKQDREKMLLKAIEEPLFEIKYKKDDETKNLLIHKELIKIIDLADILIEVLDSRNPLNCRSKVIEEKILKQTSRITNKPKRLILLLNKIDLIPGNVLKCWIKLFKKEFPVIAFKSNLLIQRDYNKNIFKKSFNNQSIGTDALFGLFKNFCRSFDSKKSIFIGFIGYPKTGKNSVINSLKHSRSIGTSSMPGFTSSLQEIQLDLNVKFIDYPGVLTDEENYNSNFLLENIKKMDPENRLNSVIDLVSRCQMKTLMKVYKIPEFNNATEFLYLIAKTRGKLKKGGIPDVDQAACSVLESWNNGYIPFYVSPPKNIEENIQMSIFSNWVKELNIETLLEANHNYSLKILYEEHKLNKTNFIELKKISNLF